MCRAIGSSKVVLASLSATPLASIKLPTLDSFLAVDFLFFTLRVSNSRQLRIDRFSPFVSILVIQLHNSITKPNVLIIVLLNIKMSELAFCSHLLAKYEDFWLKSKAPYVGPFLRPVDEVRDNAPGYYGRIRQPMDLATMRTKLEGGRYNSAADFKADFDLMISNCYEYNTAGPASLTDLAERFVKDFDWEWEQMARWRSKERSRLLKLQQPPPAPPATAQSSVSPGSNVSVADSSANERYVSHSNFHALTGQFTGSEFNPAF